MKTVKRENGRLFASSAGECPRRNTLHASEEKRVKWTAAAELYTAIGTSVHKVLQDAMFSEEALLYSEYHLPEIDGLNLGGYVDAIALVEGKIAVVEIKTCGKLPNEPRSEHRTQALIYSAITGLPAFILYQSRNVAGYDRQPLLKAYRVIATDEELVSILASLVVSTLAIRQERLLPIPAHFTGAKDCGFCPFKDFCWTGEKGQWSEVTADEYGQLLEEAEQRAKAIVDDKKKRRNGILKFLSRYGTVYAKKMLLNETWSKYLED